MQSAFTFHTLTDDKGISMKSGSWEDIARPQVPLRCPALACNHLQHPTGVA